MLRVSSSRCLIYKVHAPAGLNRRAIYFSTSGFACQELFSSFFRAFRPVSLVFRSFFKPLASTDANLFSLPRTLRFVKNFFRKSRKLPLRFSAFFLPPARRSVRIPAFLPFVNPFFDFSEFLFLLQCYIIMYRRRGRRPEQISAKNPWKSVDGSETMCYNLVTVFKNCYKL